MGIARKRQHVKCSKYLIEVFLVCYGDIADYEEYLKIRKIS